MHLREGPLPSLEWYAKLFPCARSAYRIEATPQYWWGGQPVIAAIKQTLQRPRIIIVLREPVAMLWSTFNFSKSRGRVDLAERFEDRLQLWRHEDAEWHAGTRTRPCPLTLTDYASFLRPWLEAFGPDLRVLFADRLADQPQQTVTELYRWLELDPAPAATQQFVRHNATLAPRNRSLARLATATARQTNVLFREHPAVRDLLRRGYARMNGRARTDALPGEVRARLSQQLAPRSQTLRTLLLEHGYTDLPPWLPDSG